MGINATNIKNIERKIREYNENLTLFEQQFIIIPFLASGYVDYSNFGQVQGQYQIDNFETYKRVWTGNDSFIITWKDSVEFTNNDDNTKILKNYKIGDYLLGWLENNSSNNDIATDQSFDYYKSQSSEQSLTFRINASRFKLDTNYEFMFYKIPEYSKDILYRVESIEREYVGLDLICYTLHLKALNQDLANTGQAKQQNVMPNSPGQGYYAPQIVDDYQPQKNEIQGIDFLPIDNKRWIIVDKQKMLNRPVKKVVLKAFGLCIFSNIAIWGRRAVEGRDFRDFGVPRWIFPINITNASTQTIYRVQSSESNYYWISNAQPTILFTKETFEALKSFVETDAIWSGQGFLGVNIDETKNTNPTTAETSYTYQLYGDNQLVQGKITNVPWTISLNEKKYRTDTIYGCEQYYTIKGSKRIHDAMFDAFWTQKNMLTLPITAKNTLSFGWTLGAAYASAVAKNFISTALLLLVGITGTIINKVMKPNFQGFSGIIPASLFDFMASETNGIYGGTAAQQIRLSYFENYDQENDINKFFNTQTINTSFQADLTDKIKSDRLTYVDNETTCVGQTKWANGDNVCKDGSTFLLNGDATLVELRNDESDVGFIVDAFNIQAMFKGDYSVEFLDKDDNVVWSGIYQSQGKWTGSVREINTWINTSIYGRENMFISQPLPWPKPLPDLHLIGYVKPNPILLEYKQDEITNKKDFFDDGNISWKDILINKLKVKGYSFPNKNNCSLNVDGTGWPFEMDGIILNSNWTSTLEQWIQSYEKVEIDIDQYFASATSTRLTFSFDTKYGMVFPDKLSLGNSLNAQGFTISDKQNFIDYLDNLKGSAYADYENRYYADGMSASVWCGITIYKDETNQQIKASVVVKYPSSRANLSFWVVERNKINGQQEGHKFWITPGFLEIVSDAYVERKEHHAFFGTSLRKISITPYQIPDEPQE